jgi:hypothetical protein
MMPSIERREWCEIISGTLRPRISSHSLKMKIDAIKRKTRTGNLTLDKAIEELYRECSNHYDLYKHDLFHIFKTT